jgi:hypothetical protein
MRLIDWAHFVAEHDDHHLRIGILNHPSAPMAMARNVGSVKAASGSRR